MFYPNRDINDITDQERQERDRQEEQRAEARFLRETYCDSAALRVCSNCGNTSEHEECDECASESKRKENFAYWQDITADIIKKPIRYGQQLNLFEEVA